MSTAVTPDGPPGIIMVKSEDAPGFTVHLLNHPVAAVAAAEPSIVILEQPASYQHRFRYDSEGGGAGVLYGENSSCEKKTFPKIQICGYNGPVMVVVSCVTHDSDPPKSHPHMLMSKACVSKAGQEGCKKGVCTQRVHSTDMVAEFQHLGIQCKRKKDIAQALEDRRSIRVDPYKQGFDHITNPGCIDLNAVKLCFQAFLEDPTSPGRFTKIIPPVCSKPIFDAKAKKELLIMDISDDSAPAEGGKKIIILCERVSKDDIKVRFFDKLGWQAFGKFRPEDVHRQHAISFVTPPYQVTDLKEIKKVFVELTKQDSSTSEPVPFFFTPSTTVLPATTKIDYLPTTLPRSLAAYPTLVAMIETKEKEKNLEHNGSRKQEKHEPDGAEKTHRGLPAIINGHASKPGTHPLPKRLMPISIPSPSLPTFTLQSPSLIPSFTIQSPLVTPPITVPSPSLTPSFTIPSPSMLQSVGSSPVNGPPLFNSFFIKEKPLDLSPRCSQVHPPPSLPPLITNTLVTLQTTTSKASSDTQDSAKVLLSKSSQTNRNSKLRVKRMRLLSGRVLPTASGVDLSFLGLARLEHQAKKCGYSLALTPAKGKLIVMPKFKILYSDV